MNPYIVTFQTWNKIAEVYQDKFMDLDLYDDTYDFFCEKIEKNDPKILEIGCGPGNITRYLLEKRPDFDLFGTDIAPNMIELAKKNNPTAVFKSMDCREIDEISTKFVAIICGFCMPYLSKTDCRKFVKDCADLLENNGIFYFSYIAGDYEKSGYEKGSTGDECYVYYHEEEYLQRYLQENNFEIIASYNKEFTKSNLENSIHKIIIVLRKD